MFFVSLTGGVALLNHRLMAVNPVGFRDGWRIAEETQLVGD
jgi:hypothetical protein